MKLPSTFDIPGPEFLVDFLWRMFTSLLREINGRLSFGDGTNLENIFGCYADIVSDATPDTEFEVNHTTGRVPGGFILLQQDKAGSLYKGGTAWTSSKIYLKSSVSSMSARIFII
jgi:hypothetical protein